MDPWLSHMLSKQSVTELHLQPLNDISLISPQNLGTIEGCSPPGILYSLLHQLNAKDLGCTLSQRKANHTWRSKK